MNPTTPSPVASIIIQRYEGFTVALDAGEYGPFTVATLAEADAIIARWAHTAPMGGGYDKCGIRVVWASGETYETRYDITRNCNDTIANHIRAQLSFWCGSRRPAHMTAQQYETCFSRIPAERRAGFAEMLRECAF